MSRAPDNPILEEYARLAPQYDSRWSSYVRSSVENTVARLPVERGQRILDVGCGTGQLLEMLHDQLPSVHSLGVDLSVPMLSVARSRLPNALPLVNSWAEHQPFLDASFDCIVTTSVFHYFREPKTALNEFHRLLKPGGSLVITDWCDDYLTCKIYDFFLRAFSPSHVRSYTCSQLDRLLRESFFDPISIDRYRIGAMWGLMTAQATAREGPSATQFEAGDPRTDARSNTK